MASGRCRRSSPHCSGIVSRLPVPGQRPPRCTQSQLAPEDRRLSSQWKNTFRSGWRRTHGRPKWSSRSAEVAWLQNRATLNSLPKSRRHNRDRIRYMIDFAAITMNLSALVRTARRKRLPRERERMKCRPKKQGNSWLDNRATGVAKACA